MTEIFDGIIRGELIIALFAACICMGTYIARGRR